MIRDNYIQPCLRKNRINEINGDVHPLQYSCKTDISLP